MKKLWKNQYKNILLVIGYIIVTSSVYGVWFHSLWHLWFVDVIIVLVIIAIGCVIGYFYIKSEMDKEKINVEKGQ